MLQSDHTNSVIIFIFLNWTYFGKSWYFGMQYNLPVKDIQTYFLLTYILFQNVNVKFWFSGSNEKKCIKAVWTCSRWIMHLCVICQYNNKVHSSFILLLFDRNTIHLLKPVLGLATFFNRPIAAKRENAEVNAMT